jgi:hypothetical protein
VPSPGAVENLLFTRTLSVEATTFGERLLTLPQIPGVDPALGRILGAAPNKDTLAFRKKRLCMGFSTSASYSKREAVPYARLVHCMVCTNRNPGVRSPKVVVNLQAQLVAAQTGDESVVVAVLPRYDMALTDLFARTGPLAAALCTRPHNFPRSSAHD